MRIFYFLFFSPPSPTDIQEMDKGSLYYMFFYQAPSAYVTYL